MQLKILAFLLLLWPSTVLSNNLDRICDDRTNFCTEIPKEKLKETHLSGLVFERVVDGDTFVASGRIIRIWGIDAPEKNEVAYRVAGWLLESLIKDMTLKCKVIYKDKYHRDVAQCLSNGEDIGAVMVRFGMAKDYKKYSGGYYEPEQKEAKKLKVGIWKE